MEKVDFKKELKQMFQPSAKSVEIINVPEFGFLMVDGLGNPNDSAEFQDAVQALYSVSFTIKMMPKTGAVPDGYFEYVVPPLEGLWWIDGSTQFDFNSKDNWRWTLMIMQPNFVSKGLVKSVVEKLTDKKPSPALSKVRFERFCEGLAVQIMHIGPYAEEAPTVEKLHNFAQTNGYELCGKHHEIYLGDPRRTQPHKLKTVIRQPVRKN